MVTFLLFGTFALLIALKVPIAFAMGLACIVVALFSPSLTLTFIAQGLVTSTDSFALMAIPFFVLAGELMGKGGISRRLFNFINVFVGRFYGGTAMAAVITCIFFAAISGSGPATVAAVGGMMIPMMISEGYDSRFTTVLLATAGALGIIIPPSIPLVLFGVGSGTSIGDLFKGGMIPGVFIGICLCIYVYFYSKKIGYRGNQEPFSLKRLKSSFIEAIWAILVPIIILGGIYGGIFTPTEAAVVAVFYSLFVSVFIYREVKLSDLFTILCNAAGSSATILIVIGTATTFGTIMSLERIPEAVAAGMLSISSNPIIATLLIVVILLIVGMFMDTSAAVVIFTPILFPIAMEVGINPVHFGIIMIVTLAIGFITPPVGVNLFVAMNIGKTTMVQIFPYIIPFLLVCLAGLTVILLVPQLTLFLV
ncbi:MULTISPECIES: TRAP transporter large permease [Tepidanaerobacter]|uniref:C4-dicarboxylate transporter, DctM subunit n=1 Tax=Tepidanaerobacter syntrophicus TaxID=224999 RepID=A0A0U9HEV5_9FIRM|nr:MULTISPECIES: TRAP transporter large permease [Tepidanaerobacter]GAQ25337.1 C4-dicarboxylate transporter, DctM subunit [Tepidanaerobacter syntrophicus]